MRTAMPVDGKEIVLDIVGIGIVFHSPKFAEHITEGQDYFSSHYANEQQVQPHIQRGTIVGFGTGSPGTFIFRFKSGYPPEELLDRADCRLRLGLHCSGGIVCFRDLYELLDWHSECPPRRTLPLEDGFYHVTLCSDLPSSGFIGDNQVILFYLEKLNAFPRLSTKGVPTLCINLDPSPGSWSMLQCPGPWVIDNRTAEDENPPEG
jgi:hypothetical protein